MNIKKKDIVYRPIDDAIPRWNIFLFLMDLFLISPIIYLLFIIIFNDYII